MKIILMKFIIFTIVFLRYLTFSLYPAHKLKIIDNFNIFKQWDIFNEVKVEHDKGVSGNCILLKYRLTENKKWVVISKNVENLVLPEYYEFSFYIKGAGNRNNLEFKLLDGKGNVFLKKWEYYNFPNNWKKIVVRNNDIKFGWGPNPDSKLVKVKKIEIVVSYGLGGSGELYIDELALRELTAADMTKIPVIRVKTSSCQEEIYKPEYLIDNDMNTRWASRWEDPQWIEIDLGKQKYISGLTLYWETAYGKAYDVLVSKNKKYWQKVFSETDGDGKTDYIYFKSRKIRYVKIIGKKRGTAWGYSLWEILFKTPDEIPVITASSCLKKHIANNVLDGDKRTFWMSKKDRNQWIKIDFQRINTGGGIFLIWGKEYARSYKIMVSIDGKKWHTVYNVKNGNGGIDKLYFKKSTFRFIKIDMENTEKNRYNLKEVIIKGPEEVLTTEKFYEVLAEESPYGFFPRWLYKEQSYWTIVGVKKDSREALFGEDGTIEPYKSGFTIMPYLFNAGKLITWADVEITQQLENDCIPLPSVKWNKKDISLNIKLFAHGKPQESVLYAWYRIKNKSAEKLKGKLFLTIRPFQINPPWQPGGGLTKIKNLKFTDKSVIVNDNPVIYFFTKPDASGSVMYKDDIIFHIRKGKIPDKKKNRNSNEYLSGALAFNYNLNPGEYKDVFLSIPMHREIKTTSVKSRNILNLFNKMIKKVLQDWSLEQENIEINIPDKSIVNTLKANIAYILINNDRDAIQPGSRQYERSWIRDGSMISAALLKTGNYKTVKDFINWYAHFITPEGMVPPSFRSDDPLNAGPGAGIEWDGQGAFVFLVAEYYRFTHNRQFLLEHYNEIISALKFLVKLRNITLKDDYMSDEPFRERFYGILPKSFSHEGYYPEMHSYWDDFWALKGWKDGIKIAEILDKKEDVKWMKKQEKLLRDSLYKSIYLTMEYKKINYIPGCAEKGDFDPASTSIAITICNELENLPKSQVKYTFKKYYKELKERFKPGWVGVFSPYEIRAVQAFLYMNEKEKALKLFNFLLKFQRPLKWHHFAEVAVSDSRLAQYIGDMPHTWVGAGYINAFRSFFVYEKNESLIIGAGIDKKWLDRKSGIYVKNLPTYFGKISYKIKKIKDGLSVNISGTAAPENGFIFELPFPKKVIRKVLINNKKWMHFTEKRIFFQKLPAKIIIKY